MGTYQPCATFDHLFLKKSRVVTSEHRQMNHPGWLGDNFCVGIECKLEPAGHTDASLEFRICNWLSCPQLPTGQQQLLDTGVRSPGRQTPPSPLTIQQVNGQQPDSGKFCTIPDSGKFCTILQNYCHSFRLFRFLSFKNRSKRNHSNNFTFTIYSKVDCLVWTSSQASELR